MNVCICYSDGTYYYYYSTIYIYILHIYMAESAHHVLLFCFSDRHLADLPLANIMGTMNSAGNSISSACSSCIFYFISSNHASEKSLCMRSLSLSHFIYVYCVYVAFSAFSSVVVFCRFRMFAYCEHRAKCIENHNNNNKNDGHMC